MEHIRSFFDTTTVHGLYYLNHKKKSRRLVWFVIWTICLTLCLWQSGVYVRDYLTFRVLTRVTYNDSSNLQFPAITIWNSNILRRTIIGRTIATKTVFASAEQLNVTKVMKTCTYISKQADAIDDFIEEILVNVTSTKPGSKQWEEMIRKIVVVMVVNKKMTFKKCWLKEKEFECDSGVLSTFMETYGELTPSFTINLDSAGAKLYKSQLLAGLAENDNYESSEGILRMESTVGPTNGYKFLLSVNKEEYCASQNKIYYGVGLHAMIHDRQSFPSQIDGQGSMYLSPGFRYNVVLKPKQFVRHTEHLGRCLSRYPLYVFRTNTYQQKLCQMQCLIELVWHHCGTSLSPFPSMKTALAEHAGVHEDDIPLYTSNAQRRSCVENMQIFNLKFPVAKFCPHCIQPCEETVYQHDVTAVSFPPSYLENHYRITLNESVDNVSAVGENYLILNVFFESKFVNLFEDVQECTKVDLFVFIGNSIGLFLGMSFMTFYEFVHYSIKAAVSTFRKWAAAVRRMKKRRKKIRVQRNIKVKPAESSTVVSVANNCTLTLATGSCN